MLLNSGKKLANTVNPAAAIAIANAAFKPVMYDSRMPCNSSRAKTFRISVAPVIRTSVGSTFGAKRGKDDRRRLAKSDCAMERESAPDTSWKTIGDLAQSLSDDIWDRNHDRERTQDICSNERDVGHGGKRLGSDDGDLDGGADADADNNLIADVLG